MPVDEPLHGARRREGKMPRKRPAGALRHGFYSRRFREEETKDLDQSQPGEDLQDEFKLLKVLMRRVFEAAEDENGGTLKDVAKALSACSAAMGRKAVMLSTQARLNGNTDEIVRALNEAIDEITRQYPEENHG